MGLERPSPSLSPGTGPRRGADHHLAKLDEPQIHNILRRLKGGEHPLDIAPDFPAVDRLTIWAIARGRSWRHIHDQYAPMVIKRRAVAREGERIAEIGRRSAAGERGAALAAEYGISRQRVHQLHIACLSGSDTGNRSQVDGDKCIEHIGPRTYVLDASVDPTEARNALVLLQPNGVDGRTAQSTPDCRDPHATAGPAEDS
jgi:hypothetical protein